MPNGELNWAKELVEKFAAGASHTFILHLNVSDYVRNTDGKYVGLKRYLTDVLLNGWQIVVFYDRASGIHFLNDDMKTDFFRIVNNGSKEQLKALPKDPETALPILERLMRTSPEEASKILGKEIKQQFAAILIGFAETIFPDGQITNQSVADRTNIITMAQWARRSRIEKSGNLILMMTNNLSQISPALRSPESNIECVRIPYPDFPQRKAFLEALPEMLKELDPEKAELRFAEEVAALASASAGLTRNSIKDLANQAIYQKQPLTVDFIWNRKGEILEQMSGGLLEIVRPESGFDVIGGLEYIKTHLLNIAEAIREGNVLMVPQGILMIGPPGTAKSVTAEAFAYELGFSLVKIKNMRSMWHGESESRQELVYGLIDALAPVVVFEDEIDQKETQRGNVFHGDSGVTARMTAAKMAFMSDVARRGRILWLAASNRPDLMDQAMLRPGRFDDITPFLPPNEEERCKIFGAIFRKMKRQAAKLGKKVRFEATDDEILSLVKQMDKNFTGAEIELICHRAVSCAAERKSTDENGVKTEFRDLQLAFNDYFPSRDEREFNAMTDLALSMVNSARMIPSHFMDRAKEIRQEKRPKTE